MRNRRAHRLLAVGLAASLLFGAAAGSLYFFLKPTMLRIAVGPPGSEDQKLVQTLAQIFTREGSPIRLTPITPTISTAPAMTARWKRGVSRSST